MSGIIFKLSGTNIELLWLIVKNTNASELPKQPGIIYGINELYSSLNSFRNLPPDQDFETVGDVRDYIEINKLTPEFFSKDEVEWEMPRHLALVLKAILKAFPTSTNGEGITRWWDLCGKLRLNNWLKKNFDKPVQLDDDVDFDEEENDESELETT